MCVPSSAILTVVNRHITFLVTQKVYKGLSDYKPDDICFVDLLYTAKEKHKLTGLSRGRKEEREKMESKREKE